MHERLLYVLAVVLALCACARDAVIEFPSNMSEMPAADASYYDNPTLYPDQSANQPLAKMVESITATAVAEGIPGVVMLVNSAAEGTWVSARGLIDLKNKIPMKPNSLSRIGSITKMFTAVIVHQFAEEGKVSLDDPVSKYLPEEMTHGITNAASASIRQLLGHTSGIANYTDHFDIPALCKSGSNKGLTAPKVLDLVRSASETFAPGEGCRYSNTNYILLGLIAERVIGKTMKDLYQEKIFTPLRLKSTYYDPDNPVQRGIARGYVDYPSGNLIDTTDFDQATRTPDGGIVSDVYDMATFINALVQDRRLLSQAEYVEMVGEVRSDERLGCLDGLGILESRLPNGNFVYCYSGGHFGYTAELWYVPSTKVTPAYLINGSSEIGTYVKPIHNLKSRAFTMLFDVDRDMVDRTGS